MSDAGTRPLNEALQLVSEELGGDGSDPDAQDGPRALLVLLASRQGTNVRHVGALVVGDEDAGVVALRGALRADRVRPTRGLSAASLVLCRPPPGPTHFALATALVEADGAVLLTPADESRPTPVCTLEGVGLSLDRGILRVFCGLGEDSPGPFRLVGSGDAGNEPGDPVAGGADGSQGPDSAPRQAAGGSVASPGAQSVAGADASPDGANGPVGAAVPAPGGAEGDRPPNSASPGAADGGQHEELFSSVAAALERRGAARDAARAAGPASVHDGGALRQRAPPAASPAAGGPSGHGPWANPVAPSSARADALLELLDARRRQRGSAGFASAPSSAPSAQARGRALLQSQAETLSQLHRVLLAAVDDGRYGRAAECLLALQDLPFDRNAAPALRPIIESQGLRGLVDGAKALVDAFSTSSLRGRLSQILAHAIAAAVGTFAASPSGDAGCR